MIVDRVGRSFKSLRVSLTAACNYACSYCVPDGKRLLPARYELTPEELMKATWMLVDAAGIEKLRITGGEPLLAKGFDAFLMAAAAIPGLDDVSLTTNGQLLRRKRNTIVEAGIRRINISLDTLNPLRFRQIARSGDLETVLDGIDAMLEAGIRVKINMVPVRSLNAAEVVPILDFCMERGIELRYIELMKMGHLLNNPNYENDYMSMRELLDMIGDKYEFQRIDAPSDSTSIRFEVPGKGVFGVIANVSEPFCMGCTRLRLSSAGYVYGCLSNVNKHSVRDLLAMPMEEARPLLQERLEVALADKQLAFQGETTVMKFIGG